MAFSSPTVAGSLASRALSSATRAPRPLGFEQLVQEINQLVPADRAGWRKGLVSHRCS
jgi:hypothetical protein